MKMQTTEMQFMRSGNVQVQAKRLQTIRDFQQFPQEKGLPSSEPEGLDSWKGVTWQIILTRNPFKLIYSFDLNSKDPKKDPKDA